MSGPAIRSSARAPAVTVLVVAVLAFAACVFANWPGHFPPDALSQLAQGRSGVFNTWHPPVMAWLLGVADSIIHGAPLFFVTDAALFWGALAAVTLVRRPGWGAPLVMTLAAASPLTLILQGLTTKDVLFTDASLAAFAAIAWSARLWCRPAARWVAIVVALVFLILAGLARQNGAIVSLAGALCLGAIAFRQSGRTARAGLLALVAIAVMGAVGAAATLTFRAHSDRAPEGTRAWMTLAIFDLTGAVRRDPAMPLAILRRHNPDLERFIRGPASGAYDPTRVDTLARLPAWTSLVARPGPSIEAEWRSLIVHRPGLYLAVRAEVFRQLVLEGQSDACVPVLVGVDPGQPDLLRAAGMVARDTPKDDWDGDYMTAFLATPVCWHAAYALLAVILAILATRDLARGGGAEWIAGLGLLVSALLFAASFFVIGIACDYRYLYFLDAAAMAGLVQRAATWAGAPSRGHAARL